MHDLFADAREWERRLRKAPGTVAVHTPVATTTVPADTSVPSARRTPDTRSPSRTRSVTGALPDSDTRGPRRHRERLGGLIARRHTRRGPPRRTRRRASRSAYGHSRADVGGVDLLGLHADGALGGKALAQRLHVLLADADDVSGLPEADVVAEQLLGVLEHLETRRWPWRPVS